MLHSSAVLAPCSLLLGPRVFCPGCPGCPGPAAGKVHPVRAMLCTACCGCHLRPSISLSHHRTLHQPCVLLPPAASTVPPSTHHLLPACLLTPYHQPTRPATWHPQGLNGTGQGKGVSLASANPARPHVLLPPIINTLSCAGSSRPYPHPRPRPCRHLRLPTAFHARRRCCTLVGTLMVASASHLHAVRVRSQHPGRVSPRMAPGVAVAKGQRSRQLRSARLAYTTAP